jgi:hypothetical protein
MGLRSEIQADIAEAFDADLADAVQAFTGTRTVTGAYDPSTGTSSTTTTTYTGRGVFGGYKVGEFDGQHIRATDTMLTALQSETTDTPKVGDDIAGLRVMDIGNDPAGATWSIQLRGA